MQTKHYLISVLTVCVIVAAFFGAVKATESAPEGGQATTVAILGDSLANGAATHPALAFDFGVLWKVFNGELSVDVSANQEALQAFGINDLRPPVVLWRSLRDFYGPVDWLTKNFLQAVSRLYLNTPQYSWGYITARKLGIDPGSIFLASENGAKINDLPRQVDRVLDHLGGKLPTRVLVFFTGNDLCAPTYELMTSPESYAQQLDRGLKYLINNGVEADGGTQIVVGSFLGVAQILSKPSILDQRVWAHGEHVTCRDLRQREYLPRSPTVLAGLPIEALSLSRLVPPNPARICPTLFAQRTLAQGELSVFSSKTQNERARAIDQMVEDKISLIATTIRNYRLESEKTVAVLNKWLSVKYPQRKIRIGFLPHTEQVQFEGEDMAADCFHLTLSGQMKIANAFLQGMLREESAVSSYRATDN